MISKLKIFVLIILTSQCFNQANGCSSFCITDNNNIIFAKSFDWHLGSGYVMTNHRNIIKTRYLPYDETPAAWTSKYGSVTFNLYGREYPVGGINEAGLVVEALMYDETEYPAPDKRPALDELGWVQYQLDNSATIYDVIDSEKKIRISDKTRAKIHFLIADQKGNTLIVEFLNGKATYYYNDDLPQKCLTNDTYNNSLKFLNKHSGFGGETPINYQYQNHSPLGRFAVVADMINSYKTENNIPIIDYSFDILDKVKQKKKTQFQIVYDIKQKKIYFRTLKSNQIKSVDLLSFNFDCASEQMMIDVNTSIKGDISNSFIPYDLKKNKKQIKKAYKKGRIKLSKNILIELAEWPSRLKCVDDK